MAHDFTVDPSGNIVITTGYTLGQLAAGIHHESSATNISGAVGTLDFGGKSVLLHTVTGDLSGSYTFPPIGIPSLTQNSTRSVLFIEYTQDGTGGRAIPLDTLFANATDRKGIAATDLTAGGKTRVKLILKRIGGVVTYHIEYMPVHVHPNVSVLTQHSLTGGGTLAANRTLNLVGDVASPGNNKFYRTSAVGAREWNNAALTDLTGVSITTPVNAQVLTYNGTSWVNAAAGSVSGIPINVKSYGAVGNGVANDTVAFQNAIAAVPSGGSLYVPSGVYMIGDVLMISKSNFEIYGEGRQSVLKARSDIIRHDLTTQKRDFIFKTGVYDNITFRDLSFDLTAGGNADMYGAIGIMQNYNTSEAWKTNITIRNCHAKGGSLHFWFQRVRYGWMEGCTSEYGSMRSINIYFCEHTHVIHCRTKFNGVPEDPVNPWYPDPAGSYVNTNAIDVVAGRFIYITRNFIYATGGTAISSSEHDEFDYGLYDIVFDGNHIIGAGGAGITCVLKGDVSGRPIKRVKLINNRLQGWNCSKWSDGLGDTGHDGLTVGGWSAYAGTGVEDILIANNDVDNLAPWEVPTIENDGVMYRLRITGSVNPRKLGNYGITSFTGVQGQLGSTAIGAGGLSGYPARNVRIINNRSYHSPNAGITAKYCKDGVVISGNQSRMGGWTKSNDQRHGILIDGCAGAVVTNNQIIDWAPGMTSVDQLNTTHLRLTSSIRTVVDNNIFGNFGANEDPLAAFQTRYGILYSGDGAFTLYGYNETFSFTLGRNYINGVGFGDVGHSWLVRPITWGIAHIIKTRGWDMDNTITGGRIVYPWQNNIIKTSTSAYTETLWKATEAPGNVVTFKNFATAGNITIAVQTGEYLNGILNGTETIAPSIIKKYMSNGINGWNTA